jgi:hypothetical protein
MYVLCTMDATLCQEKKFVTVEFLVVKTQTRQPEELIQIQNRKEFKDLKVPGFVVVTQSHSAAKILNKFGVCQI